MLLAENSVARRMICNCLRKYSRTVKFKTDPGINKREKILDSNDIEDEMDLDDLETDFMNVQQTHKEHVREMEARKEKIKYMIVKQKYFKERFPNFLTWQDKEQIKYLHDKDPEEWSVEKLSESFPALPETIMKILRSNYSKSDSKIVNHDASVGKNWNSFSKGEMPDLPEDLVAHLNKFTRRIIKSNPVSVQSTTRNEIVVQPNMSTEFSEIITSYQRLKNKNHKTLQEVVDPKTNPRFPNLPDSSKHVDTYLMIDKKDIKNKRNITLEHLQNKIESKALEGHLLSEEEQLILKETKIPKDVENSLAHTNEEDTNIILNKFGTTGGGVVVKTERDYNHLVYPEKIKIPKNKVKKDYTYRLNDCYYDYDGEFLYRVPGMG